MPAIRKEIMKTVYPWFIVMLAVVAMETGGCVLFVAGAAAGAGIGTVAYVDNELRVSRDVSVDRAWDAAQAAMKDLQITVIPAETHKDQLGGVMQGRDAKDRQVRIEVTRQSDTVTKIGVRVGTFASSNNQEAAQQIYDTMNKHLKP